MTEHDTFKGYRGAAKHKLKELNISVWSDVILQSTRGEFKGIILPRAETEDDQHIVLKLHNGYNVGIKIDSITSVQVVGNKEGQYKIPESEFPTDPKKPHVTLFGTGGTIASRLDYRTGAVIPAFTPGELYGAVPELAGICNLKTEKLYGIFSENMGPEQYKKTAEAIGREIEHGVDGIMIGHGTDTMHHTGAILSFMVQNPPVPIVLVGSQRSSDRPSSDAALNLINATRTAAYCDIAEVMVCMFGPTSDQYNLLHRGTRVRKMHSSYRSTFRTIGDIPLGMVSPTEFTYFRKDYHKRRKDKDVHIDTAFEEKVAIVYYYPNMLPDMIDSLIDHKYKGIVIAGTGLGHVNKPLYAPLQRAIEEDIAVYMTVQTLWGYVQMYVYDTGRDLLKIGVIPAQNMLPEVAYMKLCWALGHSSNTDEVKKIMLTPIAGEITEREPHNGYIILQGGLPEVDQFVGTYIR
ncbi:MAG: Glu-tRNA(Gln) amidotransferase subunit GatD [Candidatus Thermoplasmatota archaeon]|nr:Glu-tRNA(Gln) amidotransferase subunit GatD [Candidatus Thermoplasmatota archaeon]